MLTRFVRLRLINPRGFYIRTGRAEPSRGRKRVVQSCRMGNSLGQDAQYWHPTPPPGVKHVSESPISATVLKAVNSGTPPDGTDSQKRGRGRGLHLTFLALPAAFSLPSPSLPPRRPSVPMLDLPSVWRGEIRRSRRCARGDRLHAGQCLGRGAVTRGRMQTLPIVQLLTTACGSFRAFAAATATPSWCSPNAGSSDQVRGPSARWSGSVETVGLPVITSATPALCVYSRACTSRTLKNIESLERRILGGLTLFVRSVEDSPTMYDFLRPSKS